METKIKVAKVSIKKQTDKYTIREIETAEGLKFDTFDDLKEGQEYSGTITANANKKYNSNFKLAKPEGNGKKFAPKDWTAEKKMCALTNAVNMVIAGKVTIEQLTITRDKFFEYLNQK